MTARERLFDQGYDDTIIFENFSYDDALIGVSSDGRAIYDYDLMVEWLMINEEMTQEEAIDYIDFNAVGFSVLGGPIVMYRLTDEVKT